MSGKKRKVDSDCRMFKDSCLSPSDAVAYVAFIAQLCDQFARRFAEQRVCSQDFALFTNPFEAIVKNVPVHLQMELVDLQCDGDLNS